MILTAVSLYGKQVKSIYFSQDNSKTGTSKCRQCLSKIEKGMTRVVMEVQHNFSMYSNGGGSSVTKLFFHKTCFLENLGGVDEGKVCQACNESTSHSIEHGSGSYCLACVCSVHLGKCRVCGIVYNIHNLSRLKSGETLFEQAERDEELILSDFLVCLECENILYLATDRSIEKENKKTRILESKLRRLKEEVIQWTDED